MPPADTPLPAASAAGELLMVGIPGPTLDAATEEYLNKIKPLGVILFARNTPDRETLLKLTSDLRDLLPGVLLAIDHEGGRVDRLPVPFTHLPPALTMARKADPAMLRDAGTLHAAELRAAGFDIDFAPVLDVHTNPDNPIIGDRAFGTTPEEVAHFALPYIQGLAEGGLLGCAKHFPGHGDTASDSHLELPVLSAATHDLRRIRELELRPFSRAIAQGVPMIMTAHILVEAFDRELPATLSPRMIDGCLRNELGYKGFVVSDDLEMKAVADHWGVGPSAVMAIQAGCDACLVCVTTDAALQAHDALAAAIEDGKIERFTLSKIAGRRDKLLRRARKHNKVPRDTTCIGNAAHTELASRLA
ncbi:MAG: beta-N-acetylhexosaminidase [Hyphomicrobiaceae bacterium]|jgi:beta-N-acetylhexosaminidase